MKTTHLSFFLLSIFFFFNTIALYIDSATDKHALLSFKSSVASNPGAILHTNWSGNTSVCDWIGVTCGVKHQRVTALNLSGFDLAGTVAPHLGNLTFLRYLDIRSNNFMGFLPIELSKLRRLKVMNVGLNSFVGEIPAWLGSLPQLEQLDLHNNSFTAAMAVKVHHLKWNVEYTRWSPDGQESVVMTINGQFPGPTIRARAGDTIHLELTNKLFTEGVVIHWHGIRQNGTPWADGTASISQCAINPGETFLYRFKVDKAGTYFYHGHYGMQRSAGLYGSLIVDVAEGEKEKFEYEGEFDIFLSDWWHKGSIDQEVDLSSKPTHWIGEPQTLFINGRGQFNCSLAAQYSNSSVAPCNITGGEQYAPYILNVHPNKTYRLRIASTTALAALNLAIGNHTMTVVEADGNYVEPFTVDNIDIYSGESYSVLFTTNQNTSQNYWISAGVRGREPHTPPALTLLNYLPTSTSHLPLNPPPPTPRWDDYALSKAFSKKILAAAGSPTPPATHDRRITLLNTQNYIDGHTKWALNNISLSLPPTPYLGAIKYNITAAFNQTSPPDGYPASYNISAPPPYPNTTAGDGVYTLAFNSTVDVILQNANTLTPGVSEIHPWHLHGHDFWVLGYGEKEFEEGDAAELNLKNPPLRNTAVIFPWGWTALRFVADNAGAWAFHCHIEPHLHLGMGVVFTEGIDRLGNIPNEGFACGLTAKFLMNITVST